MAEGGWRLSRRAVAAALVLRALAATAAPDAAPPLALPDLKGETHDIAAYRGRVVLVNFWATWCPPCIVEMPAMERLRERLAGEPFAILAVNAGESEATLWRTRQRMGLDYPLLYDPERTAAAAWGVEVYPTTFIVDAGGRVAHRFQGMLDWNGPEAVALIRRLLPTPGAAPDPPRARPEDQLKP